VEASLRPSGGVAVCPGSAAMSRELRRDEEDGWMDGWVGDELIMKQDHQLPQHLYET
jgi:hypothetical protein